MSRLALIPFHSTPADLQLEGPARDSADKQLDGAIEEACKSITSILAIEKSFKDSQEHEFPQVIARIRNILPQANTRIHRSYAWLMFATLKVS